MKTADHNRLPKLKESGFTLIEVLVAFAIITIIATTVYISQRDSLFSTVRTRNMMIATNLARGFIAQSEAELEAKEFNLLKDQEEGKFPEPFERFTWRREVKEQEFSALTNIALALSADQEVEPGQQEQNQDAQQLVMKIFENYMKDSIRLLQISIGWEEDGRKKTLNFTTLLVRYNADFRVN